MQCCPLTSGDDDRAQVELTQIRTARRPHTCCECEGTIAPGSKYEITTGKWDGAWSTYKTCMMCREIRNHFACGGWYFGMLWSDLEGNFFPEMKAGGPCMEGLSPAAKTRLFERRTAWLESEDAQDAMRRYRTRKEREARAVGLNWWWRWCVAWGEIGRYDYRRRSTTVADGALTT